MLQENYPDLNQVFNGNSLMPGAFAMDRFEGAQRNQQINQAQALQDFYQGEQMNPLKVQQQQLSNDTSLAQLPGFQAESSLKQDKAGISRKTVDLQLNAQQRKLLADASDDDIKLLENTAQHLAYSDNPQESQQGQHLLALHKEVIKEKEKQRSMSEKLLAQERLAQSGRMELARENNAAGRYKKGTSLSVNEQLKSGKLSYEKAAVLTNAMADDAEANGDQEKAMLYRNMANTYAQKHVESKQAGAGVPKAGSPDLNKLEIPTNPSIPMVPMGSAKGTTAPVQQGSSNDVPDVKTLVEQAGGAFEPTKYNYRVVNGKVQRKLK